jgi:hypothetical protein
MTLDIKKSPFFEGDSFTLSISADTEPYDLSLWGLDITYDSTVLQYSSTTLTNTAFDSPTVFAATIGTVSMVTSVKSGQTVQSSSVALVNVLFTLKTGLVGTYTNVISCTIRDMVNTGGLGYVQDTAALVNDYRGSGFTFGNIVVLAQQTIGMYAYSILNELVNLLPLNPALSTQTLSIVVKGVDNKYGTSDSTVTSSSSCALASSGDSSVLTMQGCNARLTSSHTEGAASVNVNVAWQSFQAFVSFRIWFPQSASIVFVDDGGNQRNNVTLKRIYGTECSPVYTQSAFAVLASIGGRQLATVSNIDVTDFIVAASNATSILTVSGQKILGHQAGVAKLYLSGSSLTQTATNATVTVDDEYATVGNLDVVMVTGVSFQQSMTSSVASTSSASTPQVILQQVLTKEGDSGQVFVYANFDDGSRMEVTRQTGLNVSSLVSADLSISGGVSSGWTSAVAVGATSKCGLLLSASWKTCDTVTIADIAARLANASALRDAITGAGINATQVNYTETVLSQCEIFVATKLLTSQNFFLLFSWTQLYFLFMCLFFFFFCCCCMQRLRLHHHQPQASHPHHPGLQVVQRL